MNMLRHYSKRYETTIHNFG